MLTSLFSRRPAELELRLLAETESTITLGWDPIQCDGFKFTSSLGLVSHTWNGSRTSVKFFKAPGTFRVEPITLNKAGLYERKS